MPHGACRCISGVRSWRGKVRQRSVLLLALSGSKFLLSHCHIGARGLQHHRSWQSVSIGMLLAMETSVMVTGDTARISKHSFAISPHMFLCLRIPLMRRRMLTEEEKQKISAMTSADHLGLHKQERLGLAPTFEFSEAWHAWLTA